MDREDVMRIAHLARIRIDEAEAERFADQLGAVLEYVEKLSEVEVEGAEPLVHAVELRNVLRPDRIGECLPAEDVLSQAPDRLGDVFRVPRVLESGR